MNMWQWIGSAVCVVVVFIAVAFVVAGTISFAAMRVKAPADDLTPDPEEEATVLTPEEEYYLVPLTSGNQLRTHPPSQCAGQNCCIHNPSDHAMREWPQSWRGDRGLMERICVHGVGHPDPDDIAFKRAKFGELFANTEAIHGCCPERCCCGRRLS